MTNDEAEPPSLETEQETGVFFSCPRFWLHLLFLERI